MNEKPKGIDSGAAIIADMLARGEITPAEAIAARLIHISKVFGMSPPTPEQIEEAIQRDIEAQKKSGA